MEEVLMGRHRVRALGCRGCPDMVANVLECLSCVRGSLLVAYNLQEHLLRSGASHDGREEASGLRRAKENTVISRWGQVSRLLQDMLRGGVGP